MPASTPRSNGLRPLHATKLRRADLATWRTLHAEDDGMMYPLPEDDGVLWKRLGAANAHLVYDGCETLIGCFSVTVQADGIATGGTLVRKDMRRHGFASAILRLQEGLARRLGSHSLRCDVYDDNAGGVALMRKNDYRRFSWFEKPL